MTQLADQAAVLVAALASLVSLGVLVGTRSWRLASVVLADLLLAAGLLRLSAVASWSSIGAAVALLGMRVLLGLRR